MPSLSKAKPESWVLVTMPRMFTKIHLWSDYGHRSESWMSGSAIFSALTSQQIAVQNHFLLWRTLRRRWPAPFEQLAAFDRLSLCRFSHILR